LEKAVRAQTGVYCHSEVSLNGRSSWSRPSLVQSAQFVSKAGGPSCHCRDDRLVTVERRLLRLINPPTADPIFSKCWIDGKIGTIRSQIEMGGEKGLDQSKPRGASLLLVVVQFPFPAPTTPAAAAAAAAAASRQGRKRSVHATLPPTATRPRWLHLDGAVRVPFWRRPFWTSPPYDPSCW